MRIGLTYLAATALAVIAGGADALALEDCTRTTHISHGGEALHRDLGQGRVIWLDWWSQEGMAHDIVIAECGTGDVLRARTAEENMSARLPFHRTEKAAKIIEAEHQAARVFATLPRIATALEGTAKDITLSTFAQEPCACAALYAEMRGDRVAFEFEQKGTRP